VTTQQRWLAIAAFGLVALVLAVKAPAPDDLAAPASKRVPNAANSVANQNTNKNQAASADSLKLDTLQPRSMAQLDKEDMFKSKSWYIPPPPPPKPIYVPPPPPPPPPPPTAPPLPYKFMGSFQEPGQKLVVYLSRGDKLYSVSAGDTLEGTYKIESINSGQLAMLYLPLNIRQNLRIGDR
jgi:hypothetical protein